MGLLFLGYGETTKDDEQKTSILTEAKELFARVKNLSENIELKQLALQMEAACEMTMGNPNNVMTLLENEHKYRIHPSISALISQSYQQLGKMQEAKSVLQNGIFESVISLCYDMPSYLTMCTDDVAHFEEVCKRIIGVIEIFNVNKLSPVSILNLYLIAARGYISFGNTEKALEMLETYAEIAANVSDMYPLAVKGDSFFFLIDEFHNKLLNERPFGMPEIPYDEQLVKQEMADAVIKSPVFSDLIENKRFQSLTKKLKQLQTKGGL